MAQDEAEIRMASETGVVEVPLGTTKHAPKRTTSSKSKSSKKTAPKKKTVKQTVPKRPYPRASLENALKIPLALKEKNGGNAWPPTDVANALGRAATTSDFFYLAAASRDFGLTDGSRDSEQISLTPFGRDVVYAPSKAEEEKQLRQALTKVDIFKRVLEYYKGANLPRNAVFGEYLSTRVPAARGFS